MAFDLAASFHRWLILASKPQAVLPVGAVSLPFAVRENARQNNVVLALQRSKKKRRWRVIDCSEVFGAKRRRL